jgi:hypothetical protein
MEPKMRGWRPVGDPLACLFAATAVTTDQDKVRPGAGEARRCLKTQSRACTRDEANSAAHVGHK